MLTGWAVWDIEGDPDTMIAAADALRRRITAGALTAPSSELVLFGVARMLDAVAHTLVYRPADCHEVVTSAMDIARCVTSHLVPAEGKSNSGGRR